MTAAEFEQSCADRGGITVEQQRAAGWIVRPCRCGASDCRGWQLTTLESDQRRRDHGLEPAAGDVSIEKR